MASNQCGNCGNVGHFRSNCPAPKNPSLRHWHAAKAQFRREHPEEVTKMKNHKEENRKWKNEGETISESDINLFACNFKFDVLNKGVCDMTQTLFDLSKQLDVLGRPKDWEEVSKKIDSLLPLIREIFHNGDGFLYHGRMKEVQVDGDIFVSRLEQLAEIRDHLVKRVKSFVNGTLGKLAQVNSRNNPEELLRYVYEKHPPMRDFTFDSETLNRSTLRKHIRKAMVYYHPDKQADYDNDWKSLCEAISRCLTNALGQVN